MKEGILNLGLYLKMTNEGFFQKDFFHKVFE